MNKTFCFDIDGVIFKSQSGTDYTEVEPIQGAIDIINQLKRNGARIILFTARGTKTGIDWKYITSLQLLKYEVKYDELIFGKPYYDYIIDDKMITVEQLEEMVNGAVNHIRNGEQSRGEC